MAPLAYRIAHQPGKPPRIYDIVTAGLLCMLLAIAMTAFATYSVELSPIQNTI
jgi:hypothetical protein